MAFGLALFWAAAAALTARLAGWRRPLALALALTLAELARGHVLTGFPWALIGHVFLDTPMAQMASLLGPTGLTLLATLAAALPVAFGLRGLVAGAALLARLCRLRPLAARPAGPGSPPPCAAPGATQCRAKPEMGPRAGPHLLRPPAHPHRRRPAP
jgi:apolipoprotein N-acyltransferase